MALTAALCGQLLLLAPLLCQLGYADFIAVNVPKHLPAKLSSLWSIDVAALANNGDTGGSYNTGVTCVHAGAGDPSPWWVLDMQQLRIISSVRVWNRVDCCSENFHLITIGVSSIEAVWSSYNSSLVDVCTHYTGVPTSAQNPLNFICSQPVAGRYLTVNRNATGLVYPASTFHFCEIDVFAYVKSQPYSLRDAVPSFSDSAAAPLTGASLAPASRSVTECSVQCGTHPICLYALYSSRLCHMFLSPVIPSSFSDAFIAGGAAFVAVVG